ncbi:LemA family protein [Nocardia sp. NPDC058658]|uniref:LemA family protein n=1 Tax=Nocardia sp. NPDC058658 TaxID=3346580 RepID=UPI00364EB6AE
MSTGVIIAVVVVGLIVVLWYFAAYNDFVRLRNLVAESWKQIDVELQRRHDLVPNLVATVERSAAFERGTLAAVIEARNRARALTGTAGDVASVADAENALTTALGRVQMLAEQYPELGTVRNYAALQRELADLEDRIAASRRLYNANVRALNTKVESAPAMLVASLHHVSAVEYFELSEAQARAVIDVDQLFSDRTDAGQRLSKQA